MVLRFDKFLLFGDSITEYSHTQQGFSLAAKLQDDYTRKLDIVKRGFSGYNTRWALPIFKEVLETESSGPGDIKLLYIFLGTNDAATTFQGVPIDEYKSNLEAMVQLAEKKDIKIIIVGPGLHDQPLAFDSFEKKGRPLSQAFSSSKATREYADAAREVALAHKLPFLDLWYLFQKSGGWSSEELLSGKPDLSEFLHDGIHYTAKAYEVFYDALIKLIRKEYSELSPENLPRHLPDYKDIDPDNYEESIFRGPHSLEKTK
ncbi:hypothetical protein FT663_01905 [Candidozyma haemuli var. vulneris]|uniref:SGNH hydrolase-type esterase domain-containing protein n=1 Tax=Candidozyma haemuli TaxID=45357 RepID=A0A2V1ATC8_9ASCO|nr:hypothetical protein CXQ85_004530 [[Candida] haemuloni]KAF3990862.1 hypothetical protein FT662_02024 [[Candida] haemuloni var. vulneris]KAF3993401.1 hypothetical protein FT663_01905 [[Candida] haemuloni var. vulneris]PVH21012.1 hypothetical protein CXQ85_004530 [[Candida] haemuloni]